MTNSPHVVRSGRKATAALKNQAARAASALAETKRRKDWTNLLFISFAHVVAVVGLLYLALVQASPWTIGLGVVWFLCCGVSITGGYHRLFAHRAYKAGALVKLFYLCFGAASVQNSVLTWATAHRRHHTKVDTDADPYNINEGFWWAHIGWVVHKAPVKDEGARDLADDPLVRFQDKHYLAMAIVFGAVVPGLLGFLWGDPIGAFLVAGFVRLVFQWHSTFAVNSFAHMFGTRPFALTNSARDSFLVALVTFGEGYHNFHHRFQADYRNGIRWFHFDPTKWTVWSLAKIGLVSDLKRTPDRAIQRAREEVLTQLGRVRPADVSR